MSDKTALVTGATGLLGRQVVRAFERKQWAVKGTGYSRADGSQILKVDLGNASEIEKVLDEVKPLVVVHCAANRFPDKCDADPAGARALNAAATASLASQCATRSVLLVYISTDYVFPGRPGEAPYEVDAEPAPTNLYGVTKLEGERAVLAAYDSVGKQGLGVMLRVPVLYGDAEVPAESAVNVLLDAVWKAQGLAEGDQKIKMDHWSLRYPTNTEDVGRVCCDIAEKYLSTSDDSRPSLPRVLQFSSEDRYTKYEICQALGEIMGLSTAGIEPTGDPCPPSAGSGGVQRPYDTHLSTRALRGLGISVATQDFVGWWRWNVRAFRK
ncbi:hypothetical protein DL762_000597 [Monosporascus cannonballus]|uniref:RmlD-like substrate binding domain-containing protein n=1 Tax=Monosporascus cannonballus TaxID=155416 RepID=A0ABY0HJI1_9PEZI|nr:hypothetical protein DL762_000597 [Monosporascus cannonballus]